jgi:hypothetical protein
VASMAPITRRPLSNSGHASMSASGSANNRRLSPRAIRVRNRCLAALAARRALPIPTQAEAAAIGDDVQLEEAWAQWQSGHTPPTGIVEIAKAPVKRPVTKWRSRMVKTSALAAAAALGFIVGDRWLPGAAAQSGDVLATKVWSPITDSVVAALDEKLTNASAVSDPKLTLTAADLATLIFRSPRRRQTPVDSIEARLDSLLWIRGRLRGGSRFELGGDVRLSRRGVAEFRVDHLTIGGVAADSARTARLVVGVRSRSIDYDRMRFEIPLFVAGIAIMDGEAQLLKRGNQPSIR